MASCSASDGSTCVIGHKNFDSTVDYGEVTRSFNTLFEFSDKCGDSTLSNYLKSNLSKVFVHRDCRSKCTNTFKYEQFCNRNAVHDVDMSEMSTKRHGSCSSAYSFKERRYFFFVANWKCQTHNMKLQGNLGDVRHHGFMTE